MLAYGSGVGMRWMSLYDGLEGWGGRETNDNADETQTFEHKLAGMPELG